VLAKIGPVEIDVPRDVDASFQPQIVRKRQRRLTGVDQIVLSLSARGLTSGEISAHFAEVYGASVSKKTVSKITDQVLQMTAWRCRPLDEGANYYWWLRIGQNGDCCAQVRAEQNAAGSQASLLRADPGRTIGSRGGQGGRCVAELRLAVVPRRWRRAHVRADPYISLGFVSPGRPDRDRRRAGPR
jgi:hypothetical protein